VVPEAGVDLAPEAVQQRVVDHDHQRHPRVEQPRDDHVQDPQAELVGTPARIGEETMRAGVMDHPRQPRADEHPADRPQPRLGNLARDQGPEGLKSGLREARSEKGQQPIQRSGNMQEHRRRLRG